MASLPILRAEHADERIAIFREGESAPRIVQNAETDRRPFIHPILSPEGGELTENAPPHHPWQHGLYIGLNDVNGVGFWTEGLARPDANDGTFHPRPLKPPSVHQNRASWAVVTDWQDPHGLPLLTETQRWMFADYGDHYMLDLTFSLLGAHDLRFGQYAYGGLFLRMPYRAESGGSVLTSEGLGFPEAEGQRARWVAVSMPIGGSVGGVAVLDHPSNPDRPVAWRVDGQLGISPSRCIAGAWTLRSGGSTTDRYRLIAFNGEIDPTEIERHWEAFIRR